MKLQFAACVQVTVNPTSANMTVPSAARHARYFGSHGYQAATGAGLDRGVVAQKEEIRGRAGGCRPGWIRAVRRLGRHHDGGGRRQAVRRDGGLREGESAGRARAAAATASAVAAPVISAAACGLQSEPRTSGNAADDAGDRGARQSTAVRASRACGRRSRRSPGSRPMRPDRLAPSRQRAPPPRGGGRVGLRDRRRRGLSLKCGLVPGMRTDPLQRIQRRRWVARPAALVVTVICGMLRRPLRPPLTLKVTVAPPTGRSFSSG